MRLHGLAVLALHPGMAMAYAVYALEEVEAQIQSYVDRNGTHTAQNSQPSGCALACGFLDFTLPDQLSLPDDPTYEFEQSRYWSQQQALTKPACRLSPISAEQVSFAVLTSRVTECHFAVKSGGHAAFSGASNVEDGLTIDLVNLNGIYISDDQTETFVGAGNVWYDVYTHLQPLGLTVVGGRVSAIGVGGLTLGGGISFFSNRHGWACDNVNAYEVVFADGSIHNVSYSSPYSDLYWALRGGGNNFGIVTSFNLETYPQGDLWAGGQTFLYTDLTAAAINNAYYHLGIESTSDPYAQVFIAYAYAKALGIYLIVSDLQYGKPEPYPPILKNFTSIPGAVSNTLRITDLPNLTLELNDTNPGGLRQSYWTFTVENDLKLTDNVVSIYMDEMESIKDADGIVASIVFQLITTDVTSRFSKNGGNPLGLDGKGPLNLLNIAIAWNDVSDDERILAAGQNMVDRSTAAAKARGLDNPFLYQNYAALKQDVFPSYGEDNLARLKDISAKYDPSRVWQKLQRGYFKLE